MMTKLREYSKIFIVIVALSFIGLMVFEWGMDYTGLSQRQTVVGSVNGREMSYEMFSDMFQNLYQAERSRSDQELTESQVANIRGMVWDRFVQQVLLEEEMKRLNITVSDSEIVYQIRHYPLPEIRNNPSFQTNGQFDWDKYYASFSNPDVPWYQIEEYYRSQVLPFQRLQDIISSTVRVSENEVYEEYFNTNQKVRVQYLEIPFSKFVNTERTIAEEEIEDYYNDNLSEFQQKEGRKMSYVTFPLMPTTQDTQRVLSEFSEIRDRLASGEDFNELAAEYSEDPAVKTNEGRYDFFERGAMVKEFEEASFSGKVGTLVGPVETQFGQHLIKIEDKRVQDDKEQVKVSHILLKIAPGPSTREKQESAAAFFAEDARMDGFNTVTTRENLEVKETNFVEEDNQFVPGFGRNFQIYDFAFRNEIGAVSKLIETETGFHVCLLSEIREAGPRPLDEVKNIIESRLKTDKRKVEAKDYAVNIQENIDQSKSFGQIVNEDEANIVRMDSTEDFTIKASPRGIGLNNLFNATAFSLEKDEVSDMVETNRGIYWQKLLAKTEFDSTQFESTKEIIRNQLMSRKRNQAFSSWFEYLKENADIEDNRKLFNL
jgi:parvulin-like peptidyl-prolyl isomerase